MTQPPALRLFVAIELPGDILDTLTRLQHDLQRRGLERLRWVRPEGIHLTLKFLGETPSARLLDIEAAVDRAVVGIPPFELSLGRLGKFGSRNVPRVLWVDVTGDTATLARLQSQVERELAPLGYPPENRPFAAHLTLARVPPERARESAPALESAIADTPPPSGRIPVRELALMQSTLRRDGAVYNQLHTAALT